MPKSGFTRNAKAFANILHNDPGGKAAVRAAADAVAAEIGDEAFVREYDTDRFVAGVKVPAHRQAKDGAATRAAGVVGLKPGK